MASETLPVELNEAWVKQATEDADRGVIECRMCRCKAGLDEAITVWRNGVLAFALCDSCAGAFDVAIGPTERGIRVHAQRRGAVIIGGG